MNFIDKSNIPYFMKNNEFVVDDRFTPLLYSKTLSKYQMDFKIMARRIADLEPSTFYATI